MALPPDASASAGVAAIFFVLTLFAPVNFKLTGKGFKLYIPLGLSTAFRGLAHAARAGFLVSHNPNLMAVYGAFNAAGFGIAVAMCCCFMVIWLRNAAHYQPPLVARVLSGACRALVAAVIALGPILGVVAAIVVYGTHGDLVAVEHGQHMRLASSAGFTAIVSIATLFCTLLAFTWAIRRRETLRTTAAAAASAHEHHYVDDQHLPPKAASDVEAATLSHEQQHQQQQKHDADGLIFLLWGCLLLLCWCAATRLAAFDHPHLTSGAQLYYAVSVLPELIVAAVWALPTLAARVALGGRYTVWRQQQGHKGGLNSSSSSSSSSGSINDATTAAAGGVDAEVGVDPPEGVQMYGKAVA